MKTRILTFAAVLLMVAGGFVSCKEKEDSTCLDSLYSVEHTCFDPECIIGEWKLVKAIIVFSPDAPQCYDYSQYNIVYEFKMNNILFVSGITDNISTLLENGEHFYSIGDFSDGRNLMIGDNYSLWWCSISPKELAIDLTPLDGPFVKFVKLK